MSRTRHWKQRWDPSASYVFRRRLRMDGGSHPKFVMPGDPVTPEIIAKLGMVRVKRWWEAQTIERADFDPTVRGGVAKVKPAVVEESTAGIEHTGRGWYTVTLSDGSTARVRGKEAAEAALQGSV